MPRALRIEYPGAVYHVLCRGDRREDIFRGEVDRPAFLSTLGEACEKTGWKVHAYALMPNHYHLLIETPEPNLVSGMRWLQGTYTIRFNIRHLLSGHLFQGRYKALVIDPSSDTHLSTVATYIHLNPARARLVAPDQLLDHPWSSAQAYVSPGARAAWLRCDRVLDASGCSDTRSGRSRYGAMLLSRAAEEYANPAASGTVYASIRSGWYLGPQTFQQELLERLDQKPPSSSSNSGEAMQDHAEAGARRLLAGALQEQGLSLESVAAMRWTDPRKASLARLLRTRTTMSLSWVGRTLGGGAEATVCRAASRIKD